MSIARIEGAIITEERNISMNDVPQHKRHFWLPIEGEKPDHDPRCEGISGPVLVIEPTRVLRKWTITPLSRARMVSMVKDEAQRRILERLPSWKQANLTARDAELARVLSGTMIDDSGAFIPKRQLTASEMAEQIAIKRAWEWVKAVRASSDTIESLDPIPADYSDDYRWPA